jgi:hypothetical protein
MRNAVSLFATAMLIGWLSGEGTVVAAPAEGASEVQVSAGFFHAQGSDSGNLNADLSYGYYFTPGWQLGIRQALNYILSIVIFGSLPRRRSSITISMSPISLFRISAGSSDWCGTIATSPAPSDRKAGLNSLCMISRF